MSAEILSFRDVGYAYPNGARLAARYPSFRAEAIRDLTFTLDAGVATAVLGDNGSGKSTLLQLCNGLLQPDAGTVSWQGRVLDRSRAGLSRLRAEVGLVFQDPDDQLFAGSLLEDVAFGPRNQGLPESQVLERAHRSLDAVGLRDLAELPPHVLSHGMRKRAALAGVLAIQPRLLLLDEPTSGLDAESTDRLADLLAKLVAGGTSILLSTHDLDLARKVASEAMVLSKGRLVALGAFETVAPGLPASSRWRSTTWSSTPDAPGGFRT